MLALGGGGDLGEPVGDGGQVAAAKPVDRGGGGLLGDVRCRGS